MQQLVVADLSDEEASVPPPPVAHQPQRVHHLSDDECEAAAGSRDVVPVSKKRSKLSASEAYNIGVAVSRKVQKRCICKAACCLQQFQGSTDELVQLRCELRSLDKRDSDARALWIHYINQIKIRRNTVRVHMYVCISTILVIVKHTDVIVVMCIYHQHYERVIFRSCYPSGVKFCMKSKFPLTSVWGGVTSGVSLYCSMKKIY